MNKFDYKDENFNEIWKWLRAELNRKLAIIGKKTAKKAKN